MPSFFKPTALVILVLSLFSCGDETNKSETVDLDDFLPKSKKEYNYEEDTLVKAEEHSPDSIELFINSVLNNVQFRKSSELEKNTHFPDKLDYSEKFYHELSIDSVLYELVVWEFEDSLHTVNAFYNWIDCFGTGCKSIRIGESKWIYDGSFQLLVDDFKLIFIASNKNVDQKMWSDLFKPQVKRTWNYHIYQPLKRKVKWFGYKDKK